MAKKKITKFGEDDTLLLPLEMSIACVENTSKILSMLARDYKDKGYSQALPPDMPFTVPHTLFSGPGGCGKTVRVEAACDLMGCTEEDGNLIRLSPDSFSNAKEFVDILEENLSWDGYLCDQGKICHDNCEGCSIVDPINPRGPIKQQAVFIDEIHDIGKDTQVGLLLILLDFRYQFKDDSGVRDVFFPKFTCFGATTDPGLLSKPLRTRFKNKIYVTYYTDEEMTAIVESMAKQRGWKIEHEAAQILALCAQGIAREAGNHLEGLFSCWCYYRKKHPEIITEADKETLTADMARRYIEAKSFVEDGLSYDQVRLLNYLDRQVNGKYVTAGIKKILDAMGWDNQRYCDEIEPRLVARGLLDTTRSRKITQDGIAYLKEVKRKYPNVIKE